MEDSRGLEHAVVACFLKTEVKIASRNTDLWSLNAHLVSCCRATVYHDLFFPQFVVIASIVTTHELKYEDYTFPSWANSLGWCIAMSSMLAVPLYAIYKFLSVPGTFKQVSNILHWSSSWFNMTQYMSKYVKAPKISGSIPKHVNLITIMYIYIFVS